MITFANASLLAAGLAAVTVAALAWRARPAAGAAPLSGFALGVGCWSVAHLLEHLTGAAFAVALAKARWTGLVPGPFLFLLAVLAYVDRTESLPRRSRLALLALPAAVAALLWVPGGFVISLWPGFESESGLAFQGFLAVAYGALAVGSGLLVSHVVTAPGPFRSQGLALLAGIGAAWLGSVVSLFELFGAVHFHALPVGLVVLGGCLLWAVAGADLFAFTPVADRAVVERLSAGVVAFDSNGRVTRVNPAAARLLGLDGDADRFVGRDVTDVFEAAPDLVEWVERGDGQWVAGGDGQCVAGGEGDRVETTTVETEAVDGEAVVLEAELSPLRDGRGRFVGRVLLLYDVTDRRRKEAQLERQNRRLERLASIVSHDLRNPLTVAQTRLDLVRRDRDDEHLEAVAESHDRMATLVEDLLAVARQGEEHLEPEVAPLPATARRSWETADTGEGTLVVDADVAVVADHTRLRQLLENLFRNSVEHGGPDVTVTVGELPGGDGFYVADDGAGFDAADVETVFESGYSTNPDGTGLGLTVVDEVASAHGWDVAAGESDAGGARFDVAGVDCRPTDGGGDEQSADDSSTNAPSADESPGGHRVGGGGGGE